VDPATSIAARLATLRTDGHWLGPAASPSILHAAEVELGAALPAPHRALLEGADGLVLAGSIEVWPARDLGGRNRSLRTPGGWFDAAQLFFAESVGDEYASTDEAWAPDYFYLDTGDGEDPPVRYFHLTPTKIGVAAPSLSAWIDFVVRHRGLGAPRPPEQR